MHATVWWHGLVGPPKCLLCPSTEVEKHKSNILLMQSVGTSCALPTV